MMRILSAILLCLYSSLSFGAEISARIQFNGIDADSRLSWQLGLEHHINSNTAVNRMTLSQAVSVDQQQSLAVLEFRWD